MKSLSRIVLLSALFIFNIFSVSAGFGHRGFGRTYSQGYWLVFLAMIAFLFVFWIWMLIDCLKREFKKDVDKAIWIFLIVFLNILGALLYNIIIKVHDKKNRKK